LYTLLSLYRYSTETNKTAMKIGKLREKALIKEIESSTIIN